MPPDVPYRAALRALRGHASAESEVFLLLAAQDWDPTYRAAAIGSLGRHLRPSFESFVRHEQGFLKPDPGMTTPSRPAQPVAEKFAAVIATPRVSLPRGTRLSDTVQGLMHVEDMTAPFSGRDPDTKAKLVRREGGSIASEKAVALGHAAQHRGEHLLVADACVRAIAACEWNPHSADDRDSPRTCSHQHRAPPA